MKRFLHNNTRTNNRHLCKEISNAIDRYVGRYVDKMRKICRLDHQIILTKMKWCSISPPSPPGDPSAVRKEDFGVYVCDFEGYIIREEEKSSIGAAQQQRSFARSFHQVCADTRLRLFTRARMLLLLILIKTSSSLSSLSGCIISRFLPVVGWSSSSNHYLFHLLLSSSSCNLKSSEN